LPSDMQAQGSTWVAAKKWRRAAAEDRAAFLDAVNPIIEREAPTIGRSKAIDLVLSGWNNGDIGGGKLRARIGSVSRSRYYEWDKRKNDQGLPGLLPDRRDLGTRMMPEVEEACQRLVWKKHTISYRAAHRSLMVKLGKEKTPSYATVVRYLSAYRKDNWPALVCHHEGRKGLMKRNMTPALGRADADLTEPNQRWEIDTTKADIMTVDGKRWKIIAVIDVFSRMVRFFFVEREDALTVGQCIRQCILTWGLPQQLVMDNGKPYISKRIAGFLEALGAARLVCLPGTPTMKGTVERVFRTLTEEAFKPLSGYVGNSVQNRPAEIVLKYSREQAQALVDGWVTNVYAERLHGTTGQRPRERMAQPGFTPKKPHVRELDLLLMEEHSRIVRRNRIEFQGGIYHAPELATYEGQRLKFRASDFDAGEIIVYREGGFLCIAEDPVSKGWTPQEIIEKKKGANRRIRDLIQASKAMHPEVKGGDSLLTELIEDGEGKKPAILPLRDKVIDIRPGLKDTPYTNPQAAPAETEEPQACGGAEGAEPLILSRTHKYLDIRRRQMAGEPVDEADIRWFEDFMTSPEYRLAADYLERQLHLGAVS